MFPWPAMKVVNFALVPQEAARVREARELFAALSRTLIRPVMLVHMLQRNKSASALYGIAAVEGAKHQRNLLYSIRTFD